MLAALKIAGQAGAIRYGVLGATEDETVFDVGNSVLIQDGGDFAAVRVIYEDNRRASYRGVGFIGTIVAHPQGDVTVTGVDARYLSASGRWSIESQLLNSTRDDSSDGFGGFTDVSFTPRQGLNHTLSLTAFDEQLDINDFGFQVRNDFREARYRVEWLRSGLTMIRDFSLAPSLRYQENGDGFRTRVSAGAEFRFNLNNLDRGEVEMTHFPAQFDDRNSFGNGTFRTQARNVLELEYGTNTAKRVSVLGEIEYADEVVGGRAIRMEGGIVWRARQNFNLELRVAHRDRDGWLLHQEDTNFTSFDANQHQARMIFEYFPSARQHIRIDLQWAGVRAREDRFYELQAGSTVLVETAKPPGPSDDFSLSLLNFQFRYRWEIAPLSDLFIVYTKSDDRRSVRQDFNRLFSDSWNDPLQDQLVVKLRYRFGGE